MVLKKHPRKLSIETVRVNSIVRGKYLLHESQNLESEVPTFI